jgi:hypothetical protein
MVDGGSDHEANEGTLVLIEDLRAQRDRQGTPQPKASRPTPATAPAPEPEPGQDPAHLALGIAGGCRPNADETLAEHDSPGEAPPAADSAASKEDRPLRSSPDETLNRLETSEPNKLTLQPGATQTPAARAQRDATHAALRRPVPTASSAVMGTAHLPKDTPTSRPKRAGPAWTPRRTQRSPSVRIRVRARTAYFSVALLLIVGVAIATGSVNSSPRARASAARTTVARNGVAVTSTKAPNPLELLAGAIGPSVKKQEAADRSQARRATKKTSRRRRAHHVKHTTPPAVHAAVSAPSEPAPTTSAPTSGTSSTHYQPAATEPPAPSQQTGPTGPGTTVGKNCDPQCS